ncbi:hypothetical protein [Polynucleobacter sp.]|uniref:hypothetical protein n=1 Tax=Polynucleobacter sp. TaxID=2029855 RepID=UPI003F6A0E49
MADQNNAEYAGKVKGMKTFKEQEQERLLKAMVIPASELANRKQEELERSNAFTRAAADEEFVNRTEKSASPNCPTPVGQRVGVITREPFEDLP